MSDDNKPPGRCGCQESELGTKVTTAHGPWTVPRNHWPASDHRNQEAQQRVQKWLASATLLRSTQLANSNRQHRFEPE